MGPCIFSGAPLFDLGDKCKANALQLHWQAVVARDAKLLCAAC